MHNAWRAEVLIQVLAQAAGETDDLRVDLLRWLLALSPILLLLVLLVVFQWGATEAGPLGVAITVVVAAEAFQTPLRTLVVAGAKGVWDAVPILLVIFAALLLYRIGTAAGAFYALRTGVEQQSRNSMFLVLAFGWVFASFTQGIAGFGAPIAIVAPILVALRVRPVYAVVIPLIGHAWAKFFTGTGPPPREAPYESGAGQVGGVAVADVQRLGHPVEAGAARLAEEVAAGGGVRLALRFVLSSFDLEFCGPPHCACAGLCHRIFVFFEGPGGCACRPTARVVPSSVLALGGGSLRGFAALVSGPVDGVTWVGQCWRRLWWVLSGCWSRCW
jgi:hypothetical protein